MKLDKGKEKVKSPRLWIRMLGVTEEVTKLLLAGSRLLDTVLDQCLVTLGNRVGSHLRLKGA
jgi:hypothetical protein